MSAGPDTGPTGAHPIAAGPLGTARLPVSTVGGSALSGFPTILRWSLRRERWPLLIWTLATSGTVLSSFSAIAGLYPAPSDRAQLVTTIATDPAFTAMNGPLRSTSVGAITAWRIGVLGALAVGFLGGWIVVRRTRADEENGRAELLSSAPLGRTTLLASAVTVAWAGAAAIGLLSALGAVAQGQPVADSLALGAGLVGPGLVFAAVAAVAVQLFQSARSALGAVGVCLGVGYGLRAVGDTSPGARWLSWLSPLGWSQKVSPFDGPRWWVLLLFAGTTLALTAVAEMLHRRRDLGSGLFGVRPGPAGSSRLRTTAALALWLHRNQFGGWLGGFCVLGLLTGSLAATSDALLGDNARIEQMVRRLGGTGSLPDEMFAALAAIAGPLAAAYAVAAVLRLRTEETTGRAELTLSAAVGRRRLLAGHVAVAVAGPAVLLLAAGAAAGLAYGRSDGRLSRALGTGLQAMAVQLPAVLVIVGVSVAVLGWFPRQAAAGWAVLGAAALLGQVGRTLGLPEWVLEASPFTHVPPLPAGVLSVPALAVLVAVAGVLVAVGFLGFARRDIG